MLILSVPGAYENYWLIISILVSIALLLTLWDGHIILLPKFQFKNKNIILLSKFQFKNKEVYVIRSLHDGTEPHSIANSGILHSIIWGFLNDGSFAQFQIKTTPAGVSKLAESQITCPAIIQKVYRKRMTVQGGKLLGHWKCSQRRG